MASVHQRYDSPYWQAAWRDKDGKQYQKSTKRKDHFEALQIANAWEELYKMESPTAAQCRQVVNDVLARTGESRIEPVTTEQYFNRWLETRAGRIAQSTYHKYSTPVDRFLDALGTTRDLALQSIQKRHVEQFVNLRIEEGCGGTTIGQNIKVIRAVLREAIKDGHIQFNPADGVQGPKSQPVQRGTFTPAEIGILVENARGEWKTLILLGYFTGARLSDCCRMAWSGERRLQDQVEGVDFDRELLCYWSQKTEKLVTVPIHPELLKHLETLVSDDPDPYIMPGMANKGPGGRHGLSQSFKDLMSKSGIDSQPVTQDRKRNLSRRSFHSLRHSFNSGLANAGVDQKLRMAMTGHESEEINDRYTHHELKKLKQALRKLPGVF